MALHLRPEEKKVFDGLPGELKSGWNVTEETLEAFERPEELKMRSLMFRVEDEVVRRTLVEKNIEDVFGKLKSIPQSVMMEVFFTLGAAGVSRLLVSLLETATTDDDLKGIAELSRIRHALLESNADVSLPSV